MTLPRNLIFLLILLLPGPLRAEKEISVVVHVHSSVSSGHRTLLEIAQIARREGVDAVIVTDLLCERYEYGIPPFRNLIKKTVRRNSICEKGIFSYLEAIEEANQKVPEVVMMDAVVATPFYYWTGELWAGPLVLHDRGKDLLVMGLPGPADYENLPVLQTGKSRFDPYEGSQGTRPHQALIDDVRQKKGLVFWSHPNAEEHLSFPFFAGRRVELDTRPYSRDIIETADYTGMGVSLVDLDQIGNPEYESAASIGSVWDRTLLQYCGGRRKQPAWIIGELDYNGFSGEIDDLSTMLNQVFAETKTRAAIFKSLQMGKMYVVTRDPHANRRMVLNDFSVHEAGASLSARMGETLEIHGGPAVRVEISFSDNSQGRVHLILVRDGKMIQEWDQQAPFEIEYQEEALAPGSQSYYRIIAYDSGNLLSNPIFVRRSVS